MFSFCLHVESKTCPIFFFFFLVYFGKNQALFCFISFMFFGLKEEVVNDAGKAWK
jgi:hypothetical protein